MKEIKILKENSVYRVTDIFYRKGIRWQHDRDIILSDKKYSKSILHDYLLQKKYEDDFETFKKIVKQHQKKYEIATEDCLVVHLRLGDILDNRINGRGYRHYINCKKIYSNICLDGLAEIKKATIVTVLHFGANSMNNKYFYSKRAQRRSFKLLKLVVAKLNQQGLKVEFQSSENPDEDICFMAASKYFLKSLSGMSDLVEKCLADDAMVWSLDKTHVGRSSYISAIKHKSKRISKHLKTFLTTSNKTIKSFKE